MSVKHIDNYRNSFSLVPNNLYTCEKRARTFRGAHPSVEVTYNNYTSDCNTSIGNGTAKPGPTTDTSSRIARLKKLQKRTRGNVGTQRNGGTDRGAHPSVENGSNGNDSATRRAQLFGHYVGDEINARQTSGVGGESSDVIYFKNVFERTSLN
jgi:hypothetical protein